MAFQRARTQSQSNINFLELPVRNGYTIQPGMAVRIVNGTLSPAVSGSAIAGVSINRAAVTGDGTNTCAYLTDVGNSYRVARPAAMAKGDMMPGQLLDLAVGALTVTTAAKNDFVSRGYNSETDEVEVQIRTPQMPVN